MFSFRQKIFFTYVIVFLVFIGLMFPFAQRTVNEVVQKAMEDRATELIAQIRGAKDDEDLVSALKDQKALIFFRVSVISNEKKVLYDSHTKRLLGPEFSRDYVVDHVEVLKAFRTGKGYHEQYSGILGQEFAYFAKAFDFQGKTYVLRTAFPLEYVQEITKDFEFGFLGSATAILLLFSVMTWFIINYLTRPIQQIITAVKPYQEGVSITIPEIKLKPANRSDEFGQLANTLNSLSVKVGRHIDSLTQERNEKVAILESLIEGVIAVDRHGIIRFVNTVALKLLGVKSTDVLEHTLQAIPHEKCRYLLEQCQKEGTILTDTLELKKRGKKFLYLHLVAAPKKDKAGAILVIQDKTQDHNIAEMRKDFIANASHELKTPITIIRGFAETLHDNPELPEKTSAEIMKKIVKNCQKMTILIKDLLTLTDIEHIPESRLIECDLHDLAVSAAAMVQDAYPAAEIKVIKEKEQDYYLQADPNLLELALKNLIENGVKYSPEPATVTVTLEQEGDMLRVDVADRGMGIPSEELENIFHRFYRVYKSRTKKIAGTGLGLSIVETIITKHFGKIHVDSEVGKGSTFTIFLPIHREQLTELH